ncbi:MAG: DUF5660 family protein [Candidatus Gottesmanbacteria bacterium]
MNQGQSKPNIKKTNPYIVGDNVLETVRSLGGTVGKTIQQDVINKIPEDMLRDIFGTGQRSGELHTNESVNFNNEKVQPAPIRTSELLQPMIQKDLSETKQKLDAIRQELQALAKSIHGLQQEVQTAVMEMPVNPGVYHINFFEQLRQMILSIRERVDDSRVWLQAVNTKSKKRRGYWGMYKKHGTSFGLSSERNIATQAG